MDLRKIGEELSDALDKHFFPQTPEIDEHNYLDVQAMCVAEEAGEFLKAYRRYAGKARRKGSLEDVRDEIADVLITTSVFAAFLGVDINTAVEDKLKVVYSRGFKEAGNGA